GHARRSALNRWKRLPRWSKAPATPRHALPPEAFVSSVTAIDWFCRAANRSARTKPLTRRSPRTAPTRLRPLLHWTFHAAGELFFVRLMSWTGQHLSLVATARAVVNQKADVADKHDAGQNRDLRERRLLGFAANRIERLTCFHKRWR